MYIPSLGIYNRVWRDKKLLREVHFCQLTKASGAVMNVFMFIFFSI